MGLGFKRVYRGYIGICRDYVGIMEKENRSYDSLDLGFRASASRMVEGLGFQDFRARGLELGLTAPGCGAEDDGSSIGHRTAMPLEELS